jgi:hypothetical protein
VFSFTDHSGGERILVRENIDAPTDRVTIYTPGKWSGSDVIKNGDWFGDNIYDVTTFKQYLYLVTYQREDGTEQDSGQVIRINMENGYENVDVKSYDLKGYTGNDGKKWLRSGVGIEEYNGKIYVVTGVHYTTPGPLGIRYWEPGNVIEFDENLVPTERSANIGKSPGGLTGGAALHGGKLYIGCLGSSLGTVTEDGGYWVVDLATMKSDKIIDLNNYEELGLDGPYSGSGIDIAPDGTAFLMLLRYGDDWKSIAKLYVTSANKMASNDPIGTEIQGAFTGKDGISWGVIYDKNDGLFWCMAGTNLEARDRDGNIIPNREFTPGMLEGRITSVAVVKDASGDGSGSSGDGSGSGSSGGGGGGCDSGLLGGFGGLGLLALLALYAGPASRASSKCRRG